MKLTIKAKLILHSCTLVIVTVLMSILASVFLIHEQIKEQNKSRLESAVMRFERLIYNNIEGMENQFNEFADKTDTTKILLNCIQQDYFYFPSLSDLTGLGPAMGLDGFAFYFPKKFAGPDILQMYYRRSYRGVIKVASGVHILNKQKGGDIEEEVINDPGIYPDSYQPGIPYQIVCEGAAVYIKAHFDYRNTTDASDFGSTFEKGKNIGYFIMEKPLSEDLLTMDREMGVYVSLYDYNGILIGGKQPMPDVSPGSTFSNKIITIADDKEEKYDTVLKPVRYDGKPIGYASFSIPQAATIARIRQNTMWLSGVAGILGSFIALIIALLITRSITKPLSKIVSLAHGVTLGDFSQEIKVNRHDEVGVLANAFQTMKHALQQVLEETNDIILSVQRGKLETRGNAEAFSGGWRNLVEGINTLADAFADVNSELHDAKNSLERRVHERTKELAKANKDLMAEITERKKLEEQLRHAQKMEAIGRLAGGIAHDFNNILTAIIGYGNIMQLRMDKSDPLHEYVDGVLAASERAAGLTQNLLAFGRKQIISPKPVGLDTVVKGIGRLLQRVISEDIEFRTILSPEKLTVMADSGQIEQVLMNLATNARDAMPHGGVLTIKTDRADLTTEITGLYGSLKPGSYGVISVSDTGIGMDDALKQQIFEPFFTSKETGKGTGLGLSIVYGIIKQHNGEINVYSEKGNGTIFKIYLKLIESEDEIVDKPTIQIPVGGDETILIAEDDPDVRSYTKSVLKEFGYTIIEAVDGADAIQRFKENSDRINLLLLDVVMPKINGKEAYEKIHKIKGDVPVLFTSGYTADIIHNKGILDRSINFISKPVSPQDLLAKIRETLSG